MQRTKLCIILLEYFADQSIGERIYHPIFIQIINKTRMQKSLEGDSKVRVQFPEFQNLILKS